MDVGPAAAVAAAVAAASRSSYQITSASLHIYCDCSYCVQWISDTVRFTSDTLTSCAVFLRCIFLTGCRSMTSACQKRQIES